MPVNMKNVKVGNYLLLRCGKVGIVKEVHQVRIETAIYFENEKEIHDRDGVYSYRFNGSYFGVRNYKGGFCDHGFDVISILTDVKPRANITSALKQFRESYTNA